MFGSIKDRLQHRWNCKVWNMLQLTVILLLTGLAITRADVSSRIVNGYEPKNGDIPYIVYLTSPIKDAINSHNACGGSIIGHTWVLTAAHCVYERTPVTISYGSTDRWTHQFEYTISGDDIIVHPDYSNTTHMNDIALLRTPHMEFTNRTKKVELPSLHDRDNKFNNCGVKACGWGRTGTNITWMGNLLCADLEVTSNQCNSHKSLICAHSKEGKATCNGDSGGPLVTLEGAKLIGVTSYGITTGPDEGCETGLPHHFSRVTASLDWIRNITGIAY